MNYWTEYWGLTPGWEAFFWTLFNIVSPIFLPFFIVAVAADPSKRMFGIKNMIGKGELFWSVMAVAASTMYEIWQFRDLLVKTEHILANPALAIVIGLALLILYSALTVGLIASGKTVVVGPNMGLILLSASFLTIVSIMYFMAHVFLVGEQIKQSEVNKSKLTEKAIIKHECQRLKKPDCDKEGQK